MLMRTSFILAALALQGCMGYTPLYGNTQGELKNVYVNNIHMENLERRQGERRVAQLVTQQLSRTFTGLEGAGYELNVAIKESTTTLAVRRDATELRAQLSLEGLVELIDSKGEKVFNVGLTTSAAYNVEDTPFSTDSGKERARNSVAKSLSEEIVHRITLFFHSQK